MVPEDHEGVSQSLSAGCIPGDVVSQVTKTHGTGAAGRGSCIGKETARDLAQRGARVILACRNVQKADEARADIVESTGNKQVIVQHLDLSSLKSVRNFVKQVEENEKRLDILINNAVDVNLRNKLTEDGIQAEAQTNHFGPFLLTILLLGLMKNSAPSRIVVVSSLMHKKARLDADKFHITRDRRPLTNYCNAKLANLLFVNELARRLEGSGVAVNGLHPGTVRTEIYKTLTGIIAVAVNLLAALFFKTATEGAQTSIHLAVSEEVEGISGAYFEDCKLARSSSKSQDKELAKKLWDMSVKCVKLTEKEMAILNGVK
ncbi:retinol dehydrogenase 14-like [Hetaerina americana]|uniref:retinol dehydrogenase 14-like n=1 Tax=Hetaerina americana TaxID=62018 RepID=UPI003A7F2981